MFTLLNFLDLNDIRKIEYYGPFKQLGRCQVKEKYEYSNVKWLNNE